MHRILPKIKQPLPSAPIAAERQDRRAPERWIAEFAEIAQPRSPDRRIFGVSDHQAPRSPNARPPGSPRSPSLDRQTVEPLKPQTAERQTRTSKPDPDRRRPDAAGNPSRATSPDLQTATAVGLERPTTPWVSPWLQVA
jgi:hypothetical protein